MRRSLLALSVLAFISFATSASAQDRAPRPSSDSTPGLTTLPGPKQPDYHDGDPIPPGYHAARRVKKGRVVAGAIMFGAAYFGSLIAYGVASKSNDHEYWPLTIPAIGPFLTMATADVPLVKGDAAPGVLLLIDGAVQTGGIILAVLGFTDKKTILLRNDLGVRVTPMVGGGIYGISALLTL